MLHQILHFWLQCHILGKLERSWASECCGGWVGDGPPPWTLPLLFASSLRLLPQSRREASTFRLPGSSAGERNTSSFPGLGGGEKRNRAGQGAARPQGGFFSFFIFLGGWIACIRMGGRLGILRNEGAHGLDLLPVGSGCWAERGVIMGQANRAEPTPRSTFQHRSDWPRAWLGVAAAGLCRAQHVSPCTISGFV